MKLTSDIIIGFSIWTIIYRLVQSFISKLTTLMKKKVHENKYRNIIKTN